MKKFTLDFLESSFSLRKKHTIKNINILSLLYSWIGSFLAIFLISYFHIKILNNTSMSLIIASFGASAVLLFAAIDSPLAQPRNLLLGHFISALVGVISYKILYFDIFLASAIAVSTSILFMQLTSSLHPPGGATALIAVIGGENIHDLGFIYILVPVSTSALILLLVSCIIYNIQKNKEYPIQIKSKYKKHFKHKNI